MLHIANVNYESFVDGEGVRTAIFLSGCFHRCIGCQNSETRDDTFGKPATNKLIHEIACEIAKRKEFLSGITLTGGDPLYTPSLTAEFLIKLQDELFLMGCPRPNIWLYTGCTLAELTTPGPSYGFFIGCRMVLRLVDVLVEGEFCQWMADKTFKYRGSFNQRIWTKEQIEQALKNGWSTPHDKKQEEKEDGTDTNS